MAPHPVHRKPSLEKRGLVFIRVVRGAYDVRELSGEPYLDSTREWVRGTGGSRWVSFFLAGGMFRETNVPAVDFVMGAYDSIVMIQHNNREAKSATTR